MAFSTLVCAFTGALLLVGSISFARQISKEIVRAEANQTKQLFVQVREQSELHPDDIVIITSNDRAIYGLGGNPVFTSSTSVSGGNNDYTKFYFESTSALMMKVGYQSGCYYFQSLRTPQEESSAWLKTSGRYLAYANSVNIDGYNYEYVEDGHELDAKGDVIFKSALDEYSLLNADFDPEGNAYLSRQNEENRYGTRDDQDKLINPISIQFSNSYTTGGYFGYYFGKSNVRIYRKVDLSEGVDIAITKSGSKTHYSPDEDVDLEGLEIEVWFNDHHDRYVSTYSNEPDYFTPLKADYNNKTANFKWCGFDVSYSVDVSIPRQGEHYYSKVTNYGPVDDRGTYLLCIDDVDVVKVLNVSNIPNNKGDASGVGLTTLESRSSYYCDKDDLNQFIPEIADNLIKIVYDTDGYYIKIGEKYLCGKDSGHDYYYLYLGIREEAFKVYIYLNGALRTVNGDRFSYSRGVNKMYVNKPGNAMEEPDMVLYKMDLSESDYTTIGGFKELFYDKTSSVSNANWDDLKTTFNDLSCDCQGYLASLSYNHRQEPLYSLNDLADKYDYYVKQYDLEDFMARGAAGTLKNYYILDEINDIDTLTMLRYDYEKVEEAYTYSNVAIRFGGFLSQEIWDELNEDYDVQEYGVIHSTAKFLDGQTIEEKYNILNTNQRTAEEALDLLCDETDIMKVSVEINNVTTHPAIATSEQKEIMGIDTDDIYYTWTLRKNIAEDKYTTYYNAVSYIRFTEGIVFFGEASESAKHLASSTLSQTDVSDPAYESLQYFANN